MISARKRVIKRIDCFIMSSACEKIKIACPLYHHLGKKARGIRKVVGKTCVFEGTGYAPRGSEEVPSVP
jgi:hypothetical protein